ncbi:MAG: hypothetical protein WCG85_25030 [Polyangia bacterium]
MRSLFALPLLPVAVACATALPPHLTDPDHSPPPSCPSDTHLSAVGVSSQGREAALANAKRNLLTRLGNSIHVEAESFSRLVSVDGQQSAEYRDVQHVLERVDFAHSDLIQIAGAPQCRGDETYVVVCMPRAEAIARLEEDLAPEVKRFDSWDKTAQDAQGRTDRPAFVAALANLSAAMAAAVPKLVQIRALAGGTVPVEKRLTARWLALIGAATKLRAQVRFVLDLRPSERLLPLVGDVTERFRGALAALGSEVRLGTACPATPATYLISVTADANCGPGSLGSTCRPRFELEGQECASGRHVFHSGLARIRVNGADPRSEDDALRAMVRKLDPLAIRDELRAALKSELPGEETR